MADDGEESDRPAGVGDLGRHACATFRRKGSGQVDTGDVLLRHCHILPTQK
jgi:hypothetical protein